MVRDRSLSFCSSDSVPGAAGRLKGLSVFMGQKV
jgi:hypothetical protein